MNKSILAGTLRPMLAADLATVIAIERANQIAPWSDNILRDCLSLNYESWVIEIKGAVVGYIFSLIRAGECHILNVCVDNSVRRYGFATQLIQKILQIAKDKHSEYAFLEVRLTNDAAIKLYHKLGFNEIGTRKNYYPANNGREDALVFALQL